MDKNDKKVLAQIGVSGLLGGAAGSVVFSTLLAIGSQLPSKPMKVMWAVGSFVAGGLVSTKSGAEIMEFIQETEEIISEVKARISSKRRPNN